MQVEWHFHDSYTETEVRQYVPTSAGVYLPWVKLKDSNKWRCFYAGQASDLEARLLDHLSVDEENTCLKNHVAKYVCGFEYAALAGQRDRDGAEKYLYDHYKPECNQVDPSRTPIAVNLP